ncbi:hypothetical protein ABGT16_04955 [Pseudomonas asiatica]|uniref:hypothetical protein n=1 Tax=Pseudomonas asiatica TaxID=2219225 RepID=UPI00345DA7F5
MYSPRQYAINDEITSAINFGGKLLAQSCSLSRRQALDVFSIGVRFADWHELNAFLHRAWRESDSGLDWVSRLRIALVLVAANSRNNPLRSDQVSEIEMIAARMAGVLDLSQRIVLDRVFARYCGVTEWSELSPVPPISELEPLYSFDERFKRLKLSPYCMRLSQDLNNVLFGDGQLSYKRKLKWLRRTLSAHPDFLEAADHLTAMLSTGGAYEARRVIDVALESIIPLVDSYRSTLDWSVENRALLRLLHRKSLLMLAEGNARGAIEVAEKALDLCPTDEVLAKTLVGRILWDLEKENIRRAWEVKTRYAVRNSSRKT